MIDEIDKMGADFRGDPSSAMLEVLDPEQNSTFRDHYLDLRFDLSHVFFITTGNQLEPIPPALRDRMEVIQLSGYTEEEKLEIAKRYLVPRQVERNGLSRSKIEFTEEALREIIDGYTREAGVRSLEREIGSVSRKVAREFAEGTRRSKRTIRPKQVAELLGKRRFQSEVKRRTDEPGVATGLAWTPVGGDVLFVEATAFAGEGKLQVTGQVGEVMKESAEAALSYVKRHFSSLRIDPSGAPPGRTHRADGELSDDWFRSRDIHLHVPAGAIPKDGPSAGITMATALASLVTGRPVRSDTAMTGEITLTGQVLPIGGVKEKALAAQRAEIERLILPRRNEADLDDIPEHLHKRMEFVLVDTVDEVLEAALVPTEAGFQRSGDGRRASRAGSRRRSRRPARDRVAARPKE
jgi:ATP-dependent Lon protease